jgi:hypothetical protein
MIGVIKIHVKISFLLIIKYLKTITLVNFFQVLKIF